MITGNPLSAEMLQALMEAPAGSYDLAMLKPLREQITLAKAKAMGENDESTHGLLELADQAVKSLESEQIKRLDAYASGEMDEFEKAVKAKRDVEMRWIDDERQYNGERRVRDSKAYPNDAGDKMAGNSEKPAIKSTRQRVLRYTARLCDMTLSEIPIKVDAPQAPHADCYPGLTQGEDVVKYAAQAAARMESKVKDGLVRQRFTGIGERAMFDACKLGCGLIKGAFTDVVNRRKPYGQNAEIVIDQLRMPGVAYVNPWQFYYDMSATLDECSYTYEVHLLDKRGLLDLKRYPNTIGANIDLLGQNTDPKPPTALSASIAERNRLMSSVEPIKQRWAVIERHGVIDPDRLRDMLGIEWDTDKQGLPAAEFWFCDGKVVRFKLSALECDWRVPYYNLTPFECDDTIFGHGICHLGNSAQKIIDGALDATLANAAAASGPFLFVRKGNIQPSDEEWRVRGLKMFNVTGAEDEPVSNSFADIVMDNAVEQNLGLLDRGQEIFDQEILMDQIMQGNPSSEDMPASGLLQHINLQTIFQRLIARRFDETLFGPLGERTVQWYNQFLPVEENNCKGDFEVSGVASTTLVSKDLQIQHTQVLMGIAAQPQNIAFYDAYELNSSFVRQLDIPNRDKILLTKDKAEQAQQAQQQGGDPMVAVKMKQLDLQQQELKLKEQEVEYAHTERMGEIARQTAKDQADAEIAKFDANVRLQVALTQKETALIAAATSKDINVGKLAAAVHTAAVNDQTKRFIASLQTANSAHHEAQENVRTAAKLAHQVSLQDRQAGVATLHKATEVRRDHLHKAADLAHEKAMQRNQQQHDASQAQAARDAAPPPQANGAGETVDQGE